jgi:uncharacterized membrane protein
MFKLLFKYSSTVFAKGQFVLLCGWPTWVLAALAACAALGIAGLLWRNRGSRPLLRVAVLWGLESALIAFLLLLLWQPAITVAELKPEQNVLSIVVDDSRSMAVKEDGSSRKDKVLAALSSSVLSDLRKKFQVRLDRLSSQLERIDRLEQLTAGGSATHLGQNLKQLVAESATLPLGAVVLLSDGSDNAGGIDAETIAEIRRRRIPVHTVGFGREQPERDVEMSEVQMPPRVLAESRVAALVTFRQTGLSGRHTKLTVRDGPKVLASREVVFKGSGTQQAETITFYAGSSGARNLQVTLDPSEGEENLRNNSLIRVINVDPSQLRILYLEGEPAWEFKFIRRAVEDDKSLKLVTMLRTTQNKIYRQGITDPRELEEGFPAKADELFGYSGVILGGVEASYFTPAQQELLKQFVDRRGGGLLFLGGRAGLEEGGYSRSALAELLPVNLPDKKVTFFRDPATVELTNAGRDSLICRLEEDPDKNVARWRKLPYLANFQEVGAPKPGAVVLAESSAPGHGRFPLLSTQNYGQGRTAVMATAGTWRWQMQQPLDDKTHELFWQQLLRWLVADTRGRVVASTPQPVLYDDGHVSIQVRVRDTNYLPASDATVAAHVLGPEGVSAAIDLQPDPLEPGEYRAEWDAEKAGPYLVEVSGHRGPGEVGRDVFTFRREDGIAEDFHLQQNRELLEKLSEQTGGRYYRPGEIGRLAEDVVYSEAGISVRETKELWNMPAVFLLILLLRGGDWLLRRKWGAV